MKTTTSDGTVYSQSYLDTGSNALYKQRDADALRHLVLPEFARQPGRHDHRPRWRECFHAHAVTRLATLLDTGNWAFSDLAGYNAYAFDWGLPFFFGRRVFTAIEAQATPAGNGPYFAF